MTSSPTIQDVRAFWDRRPCNVKHSPEVIGSLQWSKDVTKRKYFVEPHIRRFADFKRWRYKNVLEVGCGIGSDTLEFIRAKAFVTSIDLSSESIKLAQQRVEVEGLDNFTSRYNGRGETGFFVSFHHLNAELMKCSSETAKHYDLAYSFGVIHHSPDPGAILNRIFYMLKPEGELRIMVYAKHSLKNYLQQSWEAQTGCPIVHTYTFESITKLLNDNNFDVVSIEKTHIFPWRIADYIEYRYITSLWFRWMPGWLFRRLECVLGHHLLIVAKPRY